MTLTPEKLAALRQLASSVRELTHVSVADPQTVLALVEEVEKLRKENAYWMEECYHQQAKAERLEARAPEREVGS